MIAGEVLAAVLAFGMLFTMAGRWCSRRGFPLAASLFTLLTVALAPAAMWSAEKLLGLWPEPVMRRPAPFATDIVGTVRWIPIELSAALAALVAMRRQRLGALLLVVVLTIGLAMVHATPVLFDPDVSYSLWGWMAFAVACAMIWVGHAVQRHAPPRRGELSVWVYATAMAILFVGVADVADQSPFVNHLLVPLLVVVLVALALALSQRVLLVGAGMFLLGYLAFLAKDVFGGALGFIVVTLTAGVLLLAATLWVQRTVPFALDRVSGQSSFMPSRAMYLWLGGLVFASVVLLAIALPRARNHQRELYAAQRERVRAQAEARRGRAAAHVGPATQHRGTPDSVSR